MTLSDPVYGLIEWDGSYTPTVIVGCCHDAVRRTAVEIFRTIGNGNFAADSPEFLEQHPIPDPQAPAQAIADWLEALHEATTEPWFTVLDSDEVVRTGDRLLLMDRFSAIPYVSSPGPTDYKHRHSGDSRCAAAPPPAIVNGYPVAAAVAETEDASSWIVICRRTEQVPDWAAGTSWYVTWRVWWSDGRWHAETGDYGPHHGLTWSQAQQSLLRRLDLAAPKPAPAVNPDVYLESHDDGDALTCPTCHRSITWLEGGDKLGSLLAEVTAHQCETAVDTTPPGIS